MSSGPSQDPVIQQLQLLLTGYGYNFYNTVNQARSDDLLVRERASYHLAQAVQALTALEGNFQRRFIPPSTRENPFPPAEAMNQLRDIGDFRQAVSRLESHIRGMSVPTQDKIWWRFRQEASLLARLLDLDLLLVRQSEQFHEYVAQLSPEAWQAYGAAPLRPQLNQLTQTTETRERLLLIPL